MSGFTACLLLTQAVPAQDATTTITITGRSNDRTASLAGFGDVPLGRLPISATVLSSGQLAQAGVTGLADLTRLDAATTDAYNAPGYWGTLAVRGFTLDPQFNLRRDGLPVNAETALPLGNKASLELLKGISGLQAGTSAPGGLLNLVVKRPVASVAQAQLTWTQPGTRSLAVDVGRQTDGLGWRVNAEYAHLEPWVRDSRGHRRLLALAADATLPTGSFVEVEFEHSLQSQRSTPGMSLFGPRLPDPARLDPRLNLNNQDWSLPVVMAGNTASVRLSHDLHDGWRAVLHLQRQALRTDDRIAFPYGCSAEDDYTRYCSDGRFDLYDYRSDGERRRSDALDLALSGRWRLAGQVHALTLGVLQTRHTAGFNRQAFNWVGIGDVGSRVALPADPALTEENTQRDERSTEWRIQDRLDLGDGLGLWFGMRHTRLDRRSVRTDGSAATAYGQAFSTPWLAVTHRLGALGMAYASWGQGIESSVTPNRARYLRPGQALPALRSRQLEVGLKHRSATVDWNVAMFDIQRPEWAEFGSCDVDSSCERRADGHARHRGIEADAEWRAGAFAWRGSALLLQARRGGSVQPGLNGLQPTNVPTRSLKAQVAYRVDRLPGLTLLAFASHEGPRVVVPDNSVRTPGWVRMDLAARWSAGSAPQAASWRLAVDNVADRRAWKESPYQFGHAYLYPLAPRSWSLTVQWQL